METEETMVVNGGKPNCKLGKKIKKERWIATTEECENVLKKSNSRSSVQLFNSSLKAATDLMLAT